MQLKTDCHVLVCDGAKFLLLRNLGDEDIMNLEVIDHHEVDLQQTSALARDRPGTFRGCQTHRGANEPVDPHDQAKERFVLSLLDRLEVLYRDGALSHVVVVADQRSLGCLRVNMSEALQGAVIAEVAADHAHHTVGAIEKAVARL